VCNGLPCLAREEAKKARKNRKEKQGKQCFTYTLKVHNPTPEQKNFFQSMEQVRREVYNAGEGILRDDKRNILDWKFGDVPQTLVTTSVESYLNTALMGKEKGEITRGVEIYSKMVPLPKKWTLAQLRAKIRARWDSVPKHVIWSAIRQLCSAYRSNLSKYRKAKSEGRRPKPFRIHFQKAGECCGKVIFENKNALLDFPELKELPSSSSSSSSSASDTLYVTKDGEGLYFKRDFANGGRDIHFTVTFNSKSPKSVRKSKLQLCTSHKVATEILIQGNIVTKRLWFDRKTGSCYVDVVVERDVTKAESEDPNFRLVATDPGIEPACVVASHMNEVLRSTSTTPLKKLRDAIVKLEARIQKRMFIREYRGYPSGNRRSKAQYRRTTRALILTLLKKRRHFRRFRTDFQYRDAQRFVKFGDVFILNALSVTEIAHKSKEEGSKNLGRAGRRKMYMIAPAAFLAKIKHVALRTPGKKILKGGGEKGTSKTCTFCHTWNQDLGMGKTLECRGCHRKIDRDVNAALNNLKELLNELFNSDGTPRVQQQQQQQQQQQGGGGGGGGGGEEEGEGEGEEEEEEEEVEELGRAFAC